MPSTDDSKVFQISNIDIQGMMVQIVGTTALITSHFSDSVIESIENKQQGKASEPKKPRNPEIEFRLSLYPMDKTFDPYNTKQDLSKFVFGFPAIGIKRAIVNAGSRFTKAKATELNGLVDISGDLLPIFTKKSTPEKPKPATPIMKTDRVVLQGKTSSLAYRAQFLEWSMFVPVEYNSSLISAEQVLKLFQHAGFGVGIGAWRPEKKGIYGRFSIKGL